MNIFKDTLIKFLGLSRESSESMTFNKLTLSFTGYLSNYESEFLNDYYVKALNPFRFSLILAMIFYSAFALLDAATVPELKKIFWLIRFAVVLPVLLSVFAFTYFKAFRKYMQLSITGVMFITGFGIIVMIILGARISNYSYYAGLILIFIFGYTFAKARFIYASLAGWLIIIAYEISAIWISDTPFTIMVNNNFFFISSNIIGMLTGYSLELSSRRDFYMRKLLELEQDKVKAVNSTLEKRVIDRTRQLTDTNLKLKKEIEVRKRSEKQRSELETQLFQLKKIETIGTLAGGIAHDFNNILTPILGYTDMALEEIPEDSTLRFDLEQINIAAIRGKDLVQQILTFSREVNVEKKPVKLDQIVVEVINLIKASLPHAIEIRKSIDSGIGIILADPVHIHQIIMNLCTNAIHAMKNRGGILDIKVDSVLVDQKTMKEINNLKIGIYVRIRLSDTGHGMDRRTKERIFEPFFTSKEVGSGTGLGLSVVHGIVSNYNGAITVESTPGKGTLFTVFLPYNTSYPVNEIKSSDQLPRGVEHILFVDDELDITFMGKKMLENLGYKVTTKTNSREAFEEFKRNPGKYSLLVTDQTMPKMLGTELAGKMRKINPDLKVIIITGYIDKLSDATKSKTGSYEIILKPIKLNEFSKVIRKVLDEN
jgi:signal transduction histidine kinase/ActR/RegA family two-component response regulator